MNRNKYNKIKVSKSQDLLLTMPESDMQTLTIIQPDDWHLHLRDGDVLKSTVPHAARQFHRAITMLNLNRPSQQRKKLLNTVKGYWMHYLPAVISNRL